MSTQPSSDQIFAKLESGEWEGEYIDARGHRGMLRLTLDVAGNSLRGKYELTLRTEDEPQIITGEAEGNIEGEQILLVVALGRAQEKMRYQALLRPAGSYAQQALFGMVVAAPQSDFGGGVWIAWRFSKPAGDLR